MEKFFLNTHTPTDDKVSRLADLLESTSACIIGRIIRGGHFVYSTMQNYLKNQQLSSQKIKELIQTLIDPSQNRKLSTLEAIKAGLPVEPAPPFLDSKLSQLQSHTDQLLSPIQQRSSVSWGLFCIASKFGGVDLFCATAPVDSFNNSSTNPPLITHKHFS